MVVRFQTNRSSSGSSGGLLATGRRLLPGRTRSLGAERRVSELNIMGNEGLVSTKYTLEKLLQAQKNSRVSKLELEDLVNRDGGDTRELHKALQRLLARDNNRSWQYIKFVDAITINNGPNGGAAEQWKHYAKKKQALWDQIGRHAKNKPVMFQVNLEVAIGTTVSALRGMLRVLHGLKILTRIDCGGALYGVSKVEVPDALAGLCGNPLDGSSSSYDSSDDEPRLRDTIIFTLSCMAPEATTVNKAVVFLRKCNRRLKSLCAKAHAHDEEKHEIDLHDTSSHSDTMDGSLSVHDLEVASRDESAKRKNGARLSHSSRSHKSRSPKRSRQRSGRAEGPAQLRRTKSNIERPVANNPRDDHQHHSLKRIQRKDQNERPRSSTRSLALRRTKSLEETMGCPDYDWSHNRASNCSCPDGLLVGKGNKIEPDFRWDKQGPSKTHASRLTRSLSPRPKARAYVASSA